MLLGLWDSRDAQRALGWGVGSPIALCMSLTMLLSCSFDTPELRGSDCPLEHLPNCSEAARSCSRSSKELSLSGRWEELSMRGEGAPEGLLSMLSKGSG